MSDTSEAAVEKLRIESPELATVSAHVARLLGDAEAPIGVRFAELFLSKAPPGFISERSADALAELAVDNFRFLQRARPGRVDVEFETRSEGPGGTGSDPVTILRTNLSERPFIVDTIREFLHGSGIGLELSIYPVVQVTRDEKGTLSGVAAASAGGTLESLVYCEISVVEGSDRLAELQAQLQVRLEDVFLVTDDFNPMLEAVEATIRDLADVAQGQPELADEVSEVQAFLAWLRDGGFVFLGARRYQLRQDETGETVAEVERGSGLGILRREETSAFARPVPLSDLPETLRRMAEEGPLLIISKTNARSTVHRSARMDYIGIKRIDGEGRVVGEQRFVGLFTSGAYSEKAERIPILRRKLARILEDSGVARGSHDYKEIHTIFNTLPKEELFLSSADEIGDDVRTVLTTFDPGDVRIALRRDPIHRGVSVMVILPKEKFSGDVRKRIERAFVEDFEGEVLNYHLALGEGDQARLHFYIGARSEQLDSVTAVRLEGIVRGLIRSWVDDLRDGLEARLSVERALALTERYGEAFPRDYQAATAPEEAVLDLLELEAMIDDNRRVGIQFRNPAIAPRVADGAAVTELKLFLRGERLVLSDFMPILEDCGLRVIAVTPFEIRGGGVEGAVLYTFIVQGPDHGPLEDPATWARLAEVILAVRNGDATSDSLNALALTAGLRWREIDVLRAYASYAFQVGAIPSRLALPVALLHHPDIALDLFRLFETQFDPAAYDVPEARERARRVRVHVFQEALADVQVLAEDRALRRLFNLIDATLRTNYYRGGGENPSLRSGGVPYISFKFESQRVEGAEPSRLRYEVWVRSSRMEGIHLRGAKVARGGIRHSDRPDDFRTEVLGLVKTQMVKNAVIVPAGSKGGFVTLRALPQDQMGDEAREQYKTLIRGLLDLTDNYVDGELMPPEQVVARDEPDPYLVVAADKGTARFSDVANEVAAEYGFWLGDAFASGGSNGYDHKEVGITARGGWECVRRHFLEMGKDIQAEPFTVVGIGDMSGDVFGNGMLLSRKIRLVAAFDHRHIFLDPDPDPETSFIERERLFALGRSSWGDYDASLLSTGGQITPRGSKAIELSPEARAALGIEEEGPFDGESLIRNILRAPVELLWNGGIGTYVKASTELNSAVGDPTNDAVRVSASELRTQVVGEGGNLGFTQRARIEYALKGGRCNTDAIDNSGGVDLSDREVNLKILLALPLADGDLDLDARNRLLRELEVPISHLVLADNEAQGMAISLDEIRAREAGEDLRDLMAGLERDGVLDRSAEHLPTWEDLAERREEGQGLTRPELAILLAYAKLQLTSQLLQSEVPEDPAAARYVEAYFPAAALELVGGERLRRHRLFREIVASQLANDMVNAMGAGFAKRVARGMGRPMAEVARAWLVAAELTGYWALADQLRMGRSTVPLEVGYRWILGLSRVLERTTRWILVAPAFSEQATGDAIEEHRVGLDRLRDAFNDLVTGEDREVFLRLRDELEADGAGPEVSARIATLRFLDQLLEILRAHRRTGADPVEVAQTFYRVSAHFHLPWLHRTLAAAAGDHRWQQRAAQGLSQDLNEAQERLVSRVLELRGKVTSVEEGLSFLIHREGSAIRRFQDLVDEVQAEDRAELAAVTVLVRELVAMAREIRAVNGAGDGTH